MSFTTVSVTQDYDGPDGSLPTGKLIFQLARTMTNGTKRAVATAIPIELDSSGAISVFLVANTDPGTTPANDYYWVTEQISGAPESKYSIVVPHDQGAGPLQLSDLVVYEPDTLPELIPGVTDHGALTGLADDDHIQYLTAARGDLRYYTQTEVDALISGVSAGGGVTDHGALTGLADDDHPQYHNDTRGDIRYNTKAEITSALAGKSDTSHTHSADVLTDGSTKVVMLATERSSLSSALLRLDALDGISNVGNSGSSRALTPGGGNGEFKVITLNANCAFTFNNPSNSTNVFTLDLLLTQDATGGRVPTWPASVKWPLGTAPVLSTAAGSVDHLVFFTVNGGTTWYGNLVAKGYA